MSLNVLSLFRQFKTAHVAYGNTEFSKYISKFHAISGIKRNTNTGIYQFFVSVFKYYRENQNNYRHNN